MKNKYEIRGDITAIYLKRRTGEVFETIIDTKDFERANEFRCSWCPTKEGDRVYVAGVITTAGKQKSHILHRWLLETKDGLEVDHINHNTLDNRRSNLREVNKSENQQNRKGANKNSKSGVRGVSFHSVSGLWNAKIKVNYRAIQLGYFKLKEDAIKAVEEARRNQMTHSSENKIA